MRSLARAALLLSLAACGSAATELPATRILITVDGLRADRLTATSEASSGKRAGLGGLTKTALSYSGVVAASVDPLAALVSVHTGLPVREHGVVSREHPLRNRVPGSIELLAEAHSRAGSDTLAAVVGFGPSASDGPSQEGASPSHGLQRGYARHGFGLATNGEAVDLALSGLADAAQNGQPLFVWLHLTLAGPPSSEAWSRSAQHHLASFAASDAVLAEALAVEDWSALEAHLGRRRGTPAWAALQRARYDAALIDLDRELVRLQAELERYQQSEPNWLALIGVRGEALDEPNLPPQHRVAPSRVLVPFLWRVPGVDARVVPARADLLMPAWEVSRSFRPSGPSSAAGDAELGAAPWVEVHTANAGVRAFFGPSQRWVRIGADPPVGMAHGEETALSEVPPGVLRERLAADTVSARFDGGRVELRSLSQPGKGQGPRRVDGEHTLVLLEPDEAFRVDLTFAPEVSEADVHCTGYGRLDRLPILRLPARDAAEWPEGEVPWVDVTRESGARIRVSVASTENVRLHIRDAQIREGAGRARRQWNALSHADEPARFQANDDSGEAFFEGASLDVSWVSAKTPALGVTVGGQVVPPERIRLFGRRFTGETRSFLWTSRLARQDADADRMGRFELGLTLPSSPPRPSEVFAPTVLPQAD